MEKWSDSDMDRFLEVYQQYEVLWNPRNELYRNNQARKSASQAIIKYMNKPNLTKADLKTKIKNIRTTYSRELTKIIKAKKSGAGTDDLYKPVLIWFKKADGFLRSVTEARGSKTNMDLTQDEATVSADEESADIPEHVQYETLQNAQNVTVDNGSYETPNNILHNIAMNPKETQKTRPKETAKPPTSAIRNPKRKGDNVPDTSGLLHALGTLEKISRNSISVEDEFDFFAKNIASQLRQLPIHRALYIQQDIQNILTKERIDALNMEAQLRYSSSSNWSSPSQASLAVASPSFSGLERFQVTNEESQQNPSDIIRQAFENIGDSETC